MRPIIKQECIEIEDSPPDDNNDGFQESNEGLRQDPARSNSTGPSTTRKSINVTVQREDISSTFIQEGTEELQDLGVDVYDQQTYERSVFDQVDRAFSGPNFGDASRSNHVNEQQNSSTINDLMRIIHDEHQDDNKSSDQDPVQARDDEVLQLARQQRLTRPVKTEPGVSQPNNETSSLPKIPKVCKSRLDKEQSSFRDTLATTSVKQEPSIATTKLEKREPTPSFLDHDLTDEELSSLSDDDSSASEYQPDRDKHDSDDATEEADSDTDSCNISIHSDKQSESKNKRLRDDGDFKSYASRIKAYKRSRAELRLANIDENGVECKDIDEMVKIEGDLHIPRNIWDNLFEHQKTGVRWLWELHQLGTGGILGDEMGLGKTIQMIAFLVALKTSNVAYLHNGYGHLGPTVLVCPATVMHQWLQEFRKWYPPFRVAILHSTGTFCGDRKQLVRVIHRSNGILICSYPGVIIYQDYLHALDWHYAILDEGHKIKNPDSQITLACKRFRTPHRIILSGSPVQNNLRELWSIFDFIYPGKLGTLPIFLSQFAIPITQGGYANASDMQVQIAYKCACVLRDTIKPFLLRRTKAEVNSKLKLPDRSEQVLFCKLTDKQRNLYQHFLDSPTVRDIKRGTLQIFAGIVQLRKICNHPDIFDASECNRQTKSTKKHRDGQLDHLEFFSTDETFGHYQKSGKMMVVDALLKLWKKRGDKVLLFTQSRQMLKIFGKYLNEREHKYLTMDGSTPIGIRHALIDEFNTKEDVFVFLLTTRVGGVGINLIGANRIIIYDPDWNPSTDIQARERAWRIGQQRHVIIYRLLTAGTIEEKIYHRQVFKLYLTNRILKDAKQKRFFKTNDLHELFTLGNDDKNIETKALFDDHLQIDEKSVRRSKAQNKDRRKRKTKVEPDENDLSVTQLSEEKLKELRERAKLLSKMIASKYGKDAPKVKGACSNENQSQITKEIEPLEFIQDDIPDKMGVFEGKPKKVESSEPTSAFCSTSHQSDSTKMKHDRKREKRRVEFLVRQDVYRPQSIEFDESGDGDGSRHKRDDYILGRLFKNSSIYGALKHDKIEGDSTADFKIVASEAEKVARDAIRALRESRRLCLDSTTGIPNWTGRNGQLASTGSNKNRLVPKNKAKAQQLAHSSNAPPTSSKGNESLLSSIKKRNYVNPVTIRTNNDGISLDSDEEQKDRDYIGRANEAGANDIADKIRSFILFRSATLGEAQTEEILDFFKTNFPVGKTAIFKAILYKMCEFYRRGDVGFWKLRSEFRNM